MTATSNTDSPELQLKLRALCDRIGVNYRDARYVLAHGMVPRGIDSDPGRGNHRVFNQWEAFWLAIVLKLKSAGVKPKLAAEMAGWSDRVKGLAVNLGWDRHFSPFDGQLATENRWYLEVGDAKFVWIRTDASPSRDQVADETGWVDMKTRKRREDVEPTVIICIDLSQLAGQLLSEIPP